MPYQVIVVGTDGSPRAGVAVAQAFALAKMSGAKLHAVQAVAPHVAGGFADSTAGQVGIVDARQQLERSTQELIERAKSEGLALEVHNPGSEDPADALLNAAEAVGADLIVVGNKGMSGVKRFVLGSVPNKVAHHAPCSVLIVDTDRA